MPPIPSHPPSGNLFIGLMSGTSLDGVDGALASFPTASSPGKAMTLTTAFVPFPDSLRAELMALQSPGENEIHREALSANHLAHLYAQCVALLLAQADLLADSVCSIGVHGQTIRHRPELGFTHQTNNPALLAELTGIDVVADFRSRDIAAGGQGAPLVPAFHQDLFGDETERRVVANIGGIANISVLTNDERTGMIGFDTGPGNVLMDAWIARHHGKSYDSAGDWAASGIVIDGLLDALRAEPFFALSAPKSTGRDLFHLNWLDANLVAFPDAAAENVQATLARLTATTMAEAVLDAAPDAQTVYVCGGGAYNVHLMSELQNSLSACGHTAKVSSTDKLGVSPSHVESLAFAWLAHRFNERLAGNIPSVTGAAGPRILGALYPA